MYVLGIESSCDETAAAVVKNGRHILSSAVASSLKFHRKYGGVVPEIASRKQLEVIAQVTQEALNEAKISLSDVGLISVTSKPGLAGSLLVGISFAKSLSLASDIPLLGLDHLYSHIYAGFLNNRNIRLPFIALIVSGGHTSLYEVFDFDKIKLIGSTHDDACGEAFDKVAKILGLGYPGGPAVERMARKGNGNKIKFKCSDTDNPLDFSFSGIKTAVLYYMRKKSPDSGSISDIAASFQEAVIETLVKKSFLALRAKKSRRLVIGGGVAANEKLRVKFCQRAKKEGISIYFPSKELCMDNAAMVAGLGYRLFRKGHLSDLTLNTAGQ
ncbi:MAG: tRNA (adenosine(37)-N6)-threonylcarbamoyltransferase complex transferase subunit TsaD [Candidatus Omnitrophica bacterium]|nr:tRNA (adenosine(37)-N6)-threonylcarbamoyltransferase complex transferase subunit TsaD [Candidatus Omnitrophota bacterium]